MLLPSFSYETQQGFRHFCDDLFGTQEPLYGGYQSWAWLWFRMRAAADDPRWFPRGKWATLQVVEGALDHAATKAVENPKRIARDIGAQDKAKG